MRNTAVLVKWIEEHQANPYPTKAEKQLLAYYSGMNLTQLSTWFANARRRIKKIGIKTWLEGRSTFSLDYFPTSSLQRPAMPGYAGKSNSKPFQPTVRLMHAHARTCRHYTHMSMYMHKFMGTYIRKHAYVKKKESYPTYCVGITLLLRSIIYLFTPLGFCLSVGLHGDKLHLKSRELHLFFP